MLARILLRWMDELDTYLILRGQRLNRSIEGHLTAVQRWRELQDGGVSGLVRLDRLFSQWRWASAYAHTKVAAEHETAAELRLGTESPVKVWLNGELVLAKAQGRKYLPDQLVVPVTLLPGSNSILLKSSNQTGGCTPCGYSWLFAMRLTAPGGGPLTGVRLLKGREEEP